MASSYIAVYSPEAALGLRNSDRSGHAWYSSVLRKKACDRVGVAP